MENNEEKKDRRKEEKVRHFLSFQFI
jgi:hypothetical protein